MNAGVYTAASAEDALVKECRRWGKNWDGGEWRIGFGRRERSSLAIISSLSMVGFRSDLWEEEECPDGLPRQAHKGETQTHWLAITVLAPLPLSLQKDRMKIIEIGQMKKKKCAEREQSTEKPKAMFSFVAIRCRSTLKYKMQSQVDSLRGFWRFFFIYVWKLYGKSNWVLGRETGTEEGDRETEGKVCRGRKGNRKRVADDLLKWTIPAYHK